MKRLLFIFLCICMPWIARGQMYELRYWLDNNESITEQKVSADKTIKFDIDSKTLSPGLHTLSLQVVESDGTASTPHTVSFYYAGDPNIKSIECWFDEKSQNRESIPVEGNMANLNYDVSQLDAGLHKISFQVVTSSGQASTIEERYFLRTLTDDEMGTMRCIYNIDGTDTSYEAGRFDKGIYNFDLDVSDLTDGLHRITYMLVNKNGTATSQQTAFFYKVPLGGAGIMRYDYWINDKDEVHTIYLPEHTNTYSLIELLPVEERPIRTSCFQFEVKDGKPMLYAKNDFHLFFYDTSYRLAEVNREYVDYNVSQEINDISDLQATQSFVRPNKDEIKWFKFDANYGDSIAIKSSQATSLQILSATGKELYSVEGSKSVSYGGCHVYDNGTYYVAVHDVTGSKDDITLEVQHIDRFAVFEHTPERMSGVGKTIMYFKGNGLEHVKSIELYNDDCCLTPDTIIGISSNMLARFSTIEKVPSDKKFNLKIFFNNEQKNDYMTMILENAVTFEPVNMGDIKVDIQTKGIVAVPFPIKVTVKNTGNVGCYGIPLNIAFDNVEIIDDFDFMSFKMFMSKELNETRDFFTYSDNLLGKGKKGFFMPMLIPYIGPYEEITYVFGVTTKVAHAKFNFYAWAGNPWYAPCAVYSPNIVYGAKKSFSTKSCDDSDSNLPDINSFFPSTPIKPIYPSDNPNQPYDPNLIYGPGDAIDDLTDFPISPGQLGKIGAGIGETIAGISQGATRMRDDAVLKAYGFDPSDPANDEYRYHYRESVRSPREIADNVFPTPFRNSTSKASGTDRKSIEDLANSPCPDPVPHPTVILIPGDPNEMTGYVSASGSHYMTDSIKNVSYDIEFENDPEIANSSAHVITIENQLDASKFDTSSFTPRDITISGRKIELNAEQNFVKTIDLRPAINAIGELRCDYDSQKGLAKWTLTSLDPMTMEPTDGIMQGILPVNYDGTSGIGNVTYSVDLKNRFLDGTEISNKASIIFDNNDAIETPVWTNIIDAIPPVTHVSEVEQVNDTIVRVHFDGDDNRSGVWKYALYVQYGDNTDWNQVAEIDSTHLDFRFYENIDYGFCVVATDSAGNVEQKIIQREYTFLNGKGEVVDNISTPQENKVATNRAYDLNGRLIQEEGYRGIIIKSRKKLLKR